MNNYSVPSSNASFHHIYIENEAISHPRTREILSHFKNASPIYIDHYKDIFNRPHQNFTNQKNCINLILATKKDNLIYPGAPVCQNFGEQYFYYTSLMKNCIYDCEYCYLQGMYPSANLVIYVNIEDYFKEVQKILKDHPVYLCISYDTDLLALEHLLGYCKLWIDLVKENTNLTVELRTKSNNFHLLSDESACSRFILAWTLSPTLIQTSYEHKTPALSNRIDSINLALNKGFSVRLCFDPMIYVHNWDTVYTEFLNEIANHINLSHIRDFSIGIFRIASCYMKPMQKARPDSLITCYPYENDHGVCHYNNNLSHQMITVLKDKLCHYVNEEKIYIWEETNQ